MIAVKQEEMKIIMAKARFYRHRTSRSNTT